MIFHWFNWIKSLIVCETFSPTSDGREGGGPAQPINREHPSPSIPRTKPMIGSAQLEQDPDLASLKFVLSHSGFGQALARLGGTQIRSEAKASGPLMWNFLEQVVGSTTTVGGIRSVRAAQLVRCGNGNCLPSATLLPTGWSSGYVSSVV